jgi:riboflavin kinase/FMN adenylyltransferase
MVKIKSDIEGFHATRPVLTMGMFDGVHKGHLALLSLLVKKAKETGGESVVLTFWPHPRVVLGQDPQKLQLLTTLDEKTRLLSEAGIDHIIVLPFTREFANLTAPEFIKKYLVDKIGVNHLLVGYNHRFGHGGITQSELKQLAEQHQFEIDSFGPVTIAGVKPSSTAIRQYIVDGDVREASRLLGRFYSLKGQITGGKRIGRQLGFPTANIQMDDPLKLIPHDGVYACQVHLLGKSYGGMLNVGGRPTIEGENGERSLEVHIFDFHKDVYTEEITVEFIKRTRPEIKFPNLQALKERLRNDEAEVREVLQNAGIFPENNESAET